ncbi:MAG: endonuclease III [Candidatus Kerfeldbacteria bacterium CG08_land_8_20_14_0_20_42_7]|uniref:Endonuclease III n=2 Tax=Parcubacteria group TaxID=1794811 RepID=A0A2H0YT09_9BACT|nr:MAG: endonuclease III [Candidatus Kerfeldbacteria bacterium CG08_land_8_20_14_0_20_42_7]
MSQSTKLTERIKRAKTLSQILRVHTKKYAEPVVEHVAQSYDPYRVLVSTMLSLRTKDATTALASKRLFAVAPTIKKLHHLSSHTIQKLIYPVGFYKTKAKHLLRMSDIVLTCHQGKIPNKETDLLALPGVGRKTANLVLSLSFQQDTICVDTHVQRISNRFDLVRTHTPYETEKSLQRVLPKKYWQKWNMWLVMWGQNVCVPISPKCSQCPLLDVCPQRGVTHSR